MKLFTLLISLFLTAQIIGQPTQKIRQFLHDKDFISLSKYIEESQKNNEQVRWEALRNIVDEYQEGVIKIEVRVPFKEGTASHIEFYKIKLLTTKNRIFYYTFNKIPYTHPEAAEPEPLEAIDNLKDNAEYAAFENSFQRTYGVPLDHRDLFITSIVYGDGCGFAGTAPEYMQLLNLVLEQNNIDAIRRWLHSANVEKQLYAIMGYRVLVNEGYELTDEEKRIISVVEKKEGSAFTCGGCIFSRDSIASVISEINSIPKEYLTRAGNNSPHFVLQKQSRAEKASTYWWLSISSILAIVAVLYFTLRIKQSRMQGQKGKQLKEDTIE